MLFKCICSAKMNMMTMSKRAVPILAAKKLAISLAYSLKLDA